MQSQLNANRLSGLKKWIIFTFLIFSCLLCHFQESDSLIQTQTRCVLLRPWNSTTTGPSVGGSVHVSVSCMWSLSRPSLLFHFPSRWGVRALTLMESRQWVHHFYYSSKHTDCPWIKPPGLNQAFALRGEKNPNEFIMQFHLIQCYPIKLFHNKGHYVPDANLSHHRVLGASDSLFSLQDDDDQKKRR